MRRDKQEPPCQQIISNQYLRTGAVLLKRVSISRTVPRSAHAAAQLLGHSSPPEDIDDIGGGEPLYSHFESEARSCAERGEDALKMELEMR